MHCDVREYVRNGQTLLNECEALNFRQHKEERGYNNNNAFLDRKRIFFAEMFCGETAVIGHSCSMPPANNNFNMNASKEASLYLPNWSQQAFEKKKC